MSDSDIHKAAILLAIQTDDYVFQQSHASSNHYKLSYTDFHKKSLDAIMRNGVVKKSAWTRDWKRKDIDGSIVRCFSTYLVSNSVTLTTVEKDGVLVRINIWTRDWSYDGKKPSATGLAKNLMHYYDVVTDNLGKMSFIPSPTFDKSFFREGYWMT